MLLFYFVNGLAGRISWIDALFRCIYVGTVPLLATILAACLILLPRPQDAPSRWKTALAVIGAIAACALVMGAINAFAAHFLGTEILSPRPFVTRRINALLIEPNDNSFPCPEAMLAAVFAVALWAAWPRAGKWATVAVLLFGFARVFCGSNYVADVVVGLVLGASLSALTLALSRVSLRVRSRDGHIAWKWKARYQAIFSAGIAAATLLISLWAFAATPRYEAKMRAVWSGSTASAAPVAPARALLSGQIAAERGAEMSHAPNASSPGGNAREGEGTSGASAPAVAVFPPDATLLGGNLPAAETHLLHALQALNLGHRLVSVDVAQIKAGTSSFRCAAVRFEVKNQGVEERRRVAETAARIARAAFHTDATLANLDVSGVVLNDSELAPRNMASSGATPVFTASVPRSRLTIINGPRWVNAPNVDGGSWLRARSLLFIDTRLLPATAPVLPTSTAVPTPTVAPTATPIALPTAAPKPAVAAVPAKPKAPPKPPSRAKAAKPKAVVHRAVPRRKKIRRRVWRHYPRWRPY